MKIENLTDEELFNINFNMDSEAEKRIISLLKSLNITQCSFEVKPEVEVYNLYSDKPSGDVLIKSIGYVVDRYESEINEYVYIIDDNSNFYSSDEISDMMFIFRVLKRKLCSEE